MKQTRPLRHPPLPASPSLSDRTRKQEFPRQGKGQSRQQLRRVLEQANCLVWQADVTELYPDGRDHMLFDEGRGTFVTWDIHVINQSESEVPSWLPVARERGETVTQAWLRSRDPQDEVAAEAVARAALQSGVSRYNQTFRNRMADGSIRWMQEDVHIEERAPVFKARGKNSSAERLRRWRLTGVITDVTERKRAEEALWWRANRDSLTGIPNREWIHERVHQDISSSLFGESEADPRSGALLVLDLDGFKYVNDSLGHGTGDRVLQVIASRLETALKQDLADHSQRPTCARLGGDEFVIWVSGIVSRIPGSRDHNARIIATQIAESILQAICQPTRIEGLDSSAQRELLMTGSIGISLWPEDGTDQETLFKNADTALYQAKESGRGKYRFFNRERSIAIAQHLTLETRLRQAVKREALTLLYQPQIDTQMQQIVSVEALLRWQDEELGTVSPSTFIPLAEEIGLIHTLGEFALRKACEQIAYWRRSLHPSLRICVNLSALQMVEAGMIRVVLSTLEEVGLPGDALELEITETALFRSGEQGAASFLRDVRSRGVRLAIDDFGTGYSSLSYLRNLPVDVVKIDRHFIADITENHQTRSIVRAVIDLAHALGLTVTAEGVETEGQLATLADLQCDTIQGYLYYRPLSVPDMEHLLTARL